MNVSSETKVKETKKERKKEERQFSDRLIVTRIKEDDRSSIFRAQEVVHPQKLVGREQLLAQQFIASHRC